VKITTKEIVLKFKYLKYIVYKLGYPCLACVKLFLFLSLYVSFSLALSLSALSLSLASLSSLSSILWRKKVKFKLMPPPPQKKKILINLTPAEEEKSGKIVGFLQTFGDWTFI
jgi:hypothetical protein